MRLWGPVIGIVAGSVVAGFFGLFSWDAVAAAPWFGLPLEGWPGFDFSFGSTFWALLPAFVFVTLVGAIETIGDSGGRAARILARRTGDGLPRSAGGGHGRRAGEPALGPAGHGSQHDLFEQRVDRRAHGSGGAAGWRRHRRGILCAWP